MKLQNKVKLWIITNRGRKRRKERKKKRQQQQQKKRLSSDILGRGKQSRQNSHTKQIKEGWLSEQRS